METPLCFTVKFKKNFSNTLMKPTLILYFMIDIFLICVFYVNTENFQTCLHRSISLRLLLSHQYPGLNRFYTVKIILSNKLFFISLK